MELCHDDHLGDQITLDHWLATKTPESFYTWLSNGRNHILVAELNERMAGVGTLHASGEIMLFYLRPGVQRRRIRRAILEAIENSARDHAPNSLSLGSTVGARTFYEAMGFESQRDPSIQFGVLRTYPYRKRL